MYREDIISEHLRYILPSKKRTYILIVFMHTFSEVDEQDVGTQKEMSFIKGKSDEKFDFRFPSKGYSCPIASLTALGNNTGFQRHLVS